MSAGAPLEIFGSFAQALFTFGKLSELERKINNVIRFKGSMERDTKTSEMCKGFRSHEYTSFSIYENGF
ncbi:MAG: hypothetical protein QXT63_00075 [Thermoplasmata archaeon]